MLAKKCLSDKISQFTSVGSEGDSMKYLGGRVSKAARTANAKMLRQEHAACDQGTAKWPMCLKHPKLGEKKQMRSDSLARIRPVGP